MKHMLTSFSERLTLFFRNQLLKNTPFFSQSKEDTQPEQSKINFFRIVTGIVVLAYTTVSVFQSFYFYHFILLDTAQNPIPTLLMLAALLSMLGFTMGLFTPLATLFLCLLNLPTNHHHLYPAFYGSVIFQILLIFFLLMNAGAQSSVDALILNNKKHPLHIFVQCLYKILRFPDSQQTGTLYYLIFMSFALINLSTLIQSLQDPNWTSGITLQAAFLDSALSRFDFAFHDVNAWFSQLLGPISFICILLQSLFQLGLIPLIHTQRGHRFVVVGGMVYFTGTLVLFQLSSIAIPELILWGLLFLPARQQHPTQVLFDDYCGLCHASRRTFQFLDPLNYYLWIPLSKSGAILEQYDLTHENTNKELHGLYQGKVYKGFSLYVLLSQRNPILWIFWPILWLVWNSGFGDRLYQQIADRRQAISQACSLSPPSEGTTELPDLPNRSSIVQTLLIVALLIAQLAFLLNFNIFNFKFGS